MRIVSLFEAEWECGEKPLETIETPFNMFTLGKDCINHGLSTSWNIVLQTDEEREIQDSVYRMTPCFIRQNYQTENIANTLNLHVCLHTCPYVGYIYETLA